MAIKFPTLVKEKDLQQLNLQKGLADTQKLNKETTQEKIQTGIQSLQQELRKPLPLDDENFGWNPETGAVFLDYNKEIIGKTFDSEQTEDVLARWFGNKYEPTLDPDNKRNRGLVPSEPDPSETSIADSGGGNAFSRGVQPEETTSIVEENTAVVYPVLGHPLEINNPFGGEQYRGPTIDSTENFPAKNSGVDLFAPEGTSLVSPRNGTVLQSGSSKDTGAHHGYGNSVLIRAEDGSLHRLSHLSAVQVKKGDEISAGDVIGLSGDTGNTTGPHLDYELYTPNGNLVDATLQFNKASPPTIPSGDTGGVGDWWRRLTNLFPSGEEEVVKGMSGLGPADFVESARLGEKALQPVVREDPLGDLIASLDEDDAITPPIKPIESTPSDATTQKEQYDWDVPFMPDWLENIIVQPEPLYKGERTWVSRWLPTSIEDAAERINPELAELIRSTGESLEDVRKGKDIPFVPDWAEKTITAPLAWATQKVGENIDTALNTAGKRLEMGAEEWRTARQSLEEGKKLPATGHTLMAGLEVASAVFDTLDPIEHAGRITAASLIDGLTALKLPGLQNLSDDEREEYIAHWGNIAALAYSIPAIIAAVSATIGSGGLLAPVTGTYAAVRAAKTAVGIGRIAKKPLSLLADIFRKDVILTKGAENIAGKSLKAAQSSSAEAGIQSTRDVVFELRRMEKETDEEWFERMGGQAERPLFEPQDTGADARFQDVVKDRIEQGDIRPPRREGELTPAYLKRLETVGIRDPILKMPRKRKGETWEDYAKREDEVLLPWESLDDAGNIITRAPAPAAGALPDVSPQRSGPAKYGRSDRKLLQPKRLPNESTEDWHKRWKEVPADPSFYENFEKAEKKARSIPDERIAIRSGRGEGPKTPSIDEINKNNRDLLATEEKPSRIKITEKAKLEGFNAYDSGLTDRYADIGTDHINDVTPIVEKFKQDILENTPGKILNDLANDYKTSPGEILRILEDNDVDVFADTAQDISKAIYLHNRAEIRRKYLVERKSIPEIEQDLLQKNPGQALEDLTATGEIAKRKGAEDYSIAEELDALKIKGIVTRSPEEAKNAANQAAGIARAKPDTFYLRFLDEAYNEEMLVTEGVDDLIYAVLNRAKNSNVQNVRRYKGELRLGEDTTTKQARYINPTFVKEYHSGGIMVSDVIPLRVIQQNPKLFAKIVEAQNKLNEAGIPYNIVTEDLILGGRNITTKDGKEAFVQEIMAILRKEGNLIEGKNLKRIQDRRGVAGWSGAKVPGIEEEVLRKGIDNLLERILNNSKIYKNTNLEALIGRVNNNTGNLALINKALRQERKVGAKMAGSPKAARVVDAPGELSIAQSIDRDLTAGQQTSGAILNTLNRQQNRPIALGSGRTKKVEDIDAILAERRQKINSVESFEDLDETLQKQARYDAQANGLDPDTEMDQWIAGGAERIQEAEAKAPRPRLSSPLLKRSKTSPSQPRKQEKTAEVLENADKPLRRFEVGISVRERTGNNRAGRIVDPADHPKYTKAKPKEDEWLVQLDTANTPAGEGTLIIVREGDLVMHEKSIDLLIDTTGQSQRVNPNHLTPDGDVQKAASRWWVKWFKRLFIDKGASTEAYEVAIEKQIGRPLGKDDKAYILHRLLPAAASGEAERIKKALKPIEDFNANEEKYLNIYLSILRNNDVILQGKGGKIPGLHPDGLQQSLDKNRLVQPGFVDKKELQNAMKRRFKNHEDAEKIFAAAESIQESWKGVLDELVTEGLLSSARRDEFLEKYPNFMQTGYSFKGAKINKTEELLNQAADGDETVEGIFLPKLGVEDLAELTQEFPIHAYINARLALAELIKRNEIKRKLYEMSRMKISVPNPNKPGELIEGGDVVNTGIDAWRWNLKAKDKAGKVNGGKEFAGWEHITGEHPPVRSLGGDIKGADQNIYTMYRNVDGKQEKIQLLVPEALEHVFELPKSHANQVLRMIGMIMGVPIFRFGTTIANTAFIPINMIIDGITFLERSGTWLNKNPLASGAALAKAYHQMVLANQSAIIGGSVIFGGGVGAMTGETLPERLRNAAIGAGTLGAFGTGAGVKYRVGVRNEKKIKDAWLNKFPKDDNFEVYEAWKKAKKPVNQEYNVTEEIKQELDDIETKSFLNLKTWFEKETWKSEIPADHVNMIEGGGGQATLYVGPRTFEDIRKEATSNHLGVEPGKIWKNYKDHGIGDGVLMPIYNSNQLVKHISDVLTLKPIRDFGKAVEDAPRLAGYRLAKASGKTGKEAILFSRDITLDFQRSGLFVKGMNYLCPYLNASIQGTERLVTKDLSRLFKKDTNGKWEKGTAVRAFIYGLTPVIITTIGAELYGRAYDYEGWMDVPDYLKERGFTFMLPVDTGRYEDGTKKPPMTLWAPLNRREHQFIKQSIIHGLEASLGDDPLTWKKAFTTFMSAISPIEDVTSALPPVAQEYLEQVYNYDFFRNREIINQKISVLPPKEQKSRYGTKTAEMIGEITGWSPIRVDHAVKGMTGTVGRQALGVTDLFLGDWESKSLRDAPIVGDVGARFARSAGGQIAEDERQKIAKIITDRKQKALEKHKKTDEWKNASPGLLDKLKYKLMGSIKSNWEIETEVGDVVGEKTKKIIIDLIDQGHTVTIPTPPYFNITNPDPTKPRLRHTLNENQEQDYYNILVNQLGLQEHLETLVVPMLKNFPPHLQASILSMHLKAFRTRAKAMIQTRPDFPSYISQGFTSGMEGSSEDIQAERTRSLFIGDTPPREYRNPLDELLASLGSDKLKPALTRKVNDLDALIASL